MLCLTRRNGQKIKIGDVTITVIKSRTGSCKFGIDAPKDTPITRDELPPVSTPKGK